MACLSWPLRLERTTIWSQQQSFLSQTSEMNDITKKSFLPSIHKKSKQNWTPKVSSQEKKSSDPSFLLKTREFDKLMSAQQTPPKFIDKSLVSRFRAKEDNEQVPSISNILTQAKKSSYASLTNVAPPSSAKKPDNSFRQSRYDSLMRSSKENKEYFPTENTPRTSLSPEKKPKRINGPSSFRSKSEFSKTKLQIPENANAGLEINELKVIDSMEFDNNEEEATCEIDVEMMAQNTQNMKVSKKKKGYTALSEMVPLNLEEERQVFFEKEFKYNPQFEYNMQTFKQHFEKPHTKYMKIAKLILNSCIRDYGDDEKYMEATGGRIITREETETYFDNYIKDLGLEGCLDIVFSEKTVAPTSVIHDPNGRSRVVISLPIAYREKRIMGVMHHEIGTHFIRKHNDRMQVWFKNRKKFELKPYLIIEEGLAALNQTLEPATKSGRDPYLWNSALHYYSCYMASVLGLEALFKDLEKYIQDPIKRWKECVRVKRGFSDTSQPGGMYKDQVYLRGAIEILKKRKKIDFILLYAGKINVKDLQKLAKSGVIKTDNMKLPVFLKDLEEYKAALDRIAAVNFIDTLK